MVNITKMQRNRNKITLKWNQSNSIQIRKSVLTPIIIAFSYEEQDFGPTKISYQLLLVNLSLVWLTFAVSSPGRGCGSAAPPGAVWCPAARLSVSGISSSAAAPHAAPLHCPPAGLSAKHTDSQWVCTGGSVHPVCVLSRCMSFS